MGLSLSKNGAIFFYFIHMRPRWRIFTARVSTGSTVREIWKDGGVLRFFRGNGLNVMKVAPECAIKFYSCEMLKNIIASIKGEEQGELELLDVLWLGAWMVQ
ncbi:hypothetical protein T459_26223 [Capsicum annuum]|uniref:Uncharacterized protein n=1 Tax=Capsicum annuum TaxID=4072 RepID=A0A2G2YMX6_CAPAN|nr:hypothetical protein T459_26223 [Capsicum annuum]